MNIKILRQKDIKKYRDSKLLYQKGIDPILDQEVVNPVLDHNHKHGFLRDVLDRETNQFLGKLESNFTRFILWKYRSANLPDMLRRIATYLEQRRDSPLHPGFISLNIKKFSRLKLEDQKLVLLKECGYLQVGKTKKENTSLYKAFLMREENIYKIE